MPELRRRRQPERDEIRAAERWFLTHGLTYVVPSERARARAALSPRAALPALLVAVLVAAAGVVAAIWLLDDREQRTAFPAIALSCLVGAALYYLLVPLRTARIVRWALSRTLGSIALLVPMVSRALPLLLVFVTFLFINAEVWQMSAALTPGLLWLTVLLLLVFGLVFLMVRLPEEVDRVDDHVDETFLRRTCRGTPLEAGCERLLGTSGPAPTSYATVTGFARWNLVLVLLVVQAVQVLLLFVAVFAFFLLFGTLVMSEEVQESWTGLASVHSFRFLPTVSVELVQVSVFLAAFSGLYFTVAAVTDDTYRGQFFASVTDELERAVGTRAVYLALREERRSGEGSGGNDEHDGGEVSAPGSA